VTLFKIQPAPKTDHITSDGTELQQRPYPIVVDEYGDVPEPGQRSTGVVRVVGFTKDLARQEIDVPWWMFMRGRCAMSDLVGSYVVIEQASGQLATLMTAVETFEKVR